MESSGWQNLREFIITWRIVNFSYSWHNNGEAILSPEFCSDTLQSTEWRLILYPRGKNRHDYISCYLKRNGVGPSEIEVKVEISLLGLEGLPLAQRNSKSESFSTNSQKGYNTLVKRDDVFGEKRAEFLPEDILTVRCRLWRDETYVIKPEQHYLQTRLQVVRKLISGVLEEFCTTPADTVKSLRLTSTSEEKKQFGMNLRLTERKNGDMNLMLQIIFPDNQLKKIATGKVYLLDAEENKLECGESDIDFEEKQDWEFLLFPTKWKLMAKKSLYLPSDMLHLECEIIIATGVLSEEIENNEDGLSCIPNPISNINKFGDPVINSTALADLRNLYLDKVLCDVTLQTSTEVFPAHAVILSARSPVFRAMLTTDMKEKNNACVNISDFDSETVQHLLLYAYTDTIGDLNWDTAFQLYEAADKYAIISLKKKCSAVLKEFIGPTKACELLALADIHQDFDLKKFTQNYISQNYDKILGSNEWKDLEQKNPQLLIETFTRLFSNVKTF